MPSICFSMSFTKLSSSVVDSSEKLYPLPSVARVAANNPPAKAGRVQSARRLGRPPNWPAFPAKSCASPVPEPRPLQRFPAAGSVTATTYTPLEKQGDLHVTSDPRTRPVAQSPPRPLLRSETCNAAAFAESPRSHRGANAVRLVVPSLRRIPICTVSHLRTVEELPPSLPRTQFNPPGLRVLLLMSLEASGIPGLLSGLRAADRGGLADVSRDNRD